MKKPKSFNELWEVIEDCAAVEGVEAALPALKIICQKVWTIRQVEVDELRRTVKLQKKEIEHLKCESLSNKCNCGREK